MIRWLLTYGIVLWGGVLSAQVLDTICIIGNPSYLAVDSTPGSSYHWTVNGGTILSGQGTREVHVDWGPHPGIYKVQVQEESDLGCKPDPREAYISLTLPGQARIEGPKKACIGEEVTLQGLGHDDLEWNGELRNTSMTFIAEKDTIVYLVAHNSACDNDTTYYKVEVNEQPSAEIITSSDTAYPYQEVTFYCPKEFQGEEVYWYVNGRYEATGPTFTYTFDGYGEFDVVAEVDNGTCTDTALLRFVINDEFDVDIPNAFTPNNDGRNDRYGFWAKGYTEFKAQIYNRWGELVYQWDDEPKRGWDGTFKGRRAQEGAYVYYITITDFRNHTHQFKGELILVR